MLPWFFRDPTRLTLERTAIDDLSKRVDWLVGIEWRFEGELVLDAVVRAHGHDYEIRVSFPLLFPDAPAVVRPRNMQHRISTHQYGGADGPLCLEWGPDNWNSGVTAAGMLESTFRLLDHENPLGESRPEIPSIAPSRHQLTVGQELRSKWIRWYVSSALTEYLRALPSDAVGAVRASLHQYDETWVGLIHSLTPIGGTEWQDTSVASGHLHSNDFDVGAFFKTKLTSDEIGEPKKLSALLGILAAYRGNELLASDGTSPIAGIKPGLLAGILIVDASGAEHLFIVFGGDTVLRCTPVKSPPGSIRPRAPLNETLAGKAVAIIGCGSIGSTIALGLARAGITKFHLVDYDILLPENLRRNGLDWQGVLLHKVDAVKAAISRVIPNCEVKTSSVHLAGQESNAFVGVTQSQLAACDILVDATGNAKAFNIVNAIAKAAQRPMVWMEVFGGGIGGLVARSRPGIDPVPQEMRHALLQFCQQHPDSAPELQLEDYAAEQDGKVVVASDAEAGIIAHTAVRLITDCLGAEKSRFPYSMYLVGFDTAWVFQAPFDTIPIAMDQYSADGWKAGEDTKFTEADSDFLLKLIEGEENAPDNPK